MTHLNHSIQSHKQVARQKSEHKSEIIMNSMSMMNRSSSCSSVRAKQSSSSKHNANYQLSKIYLPSPKLNKRYQFSILPSVWIQLCFLRSLFFFYFYAWFSIYTCYFRMKNWTTKSTWRSEYWMGLWSCWTQFVRQIRRVYFKRRTIRWIPPAHWEPIIHLAVIVFCPDRPIIHHWARLF